MMLKIDAKFEEKLTCAFKNDKNILPEHVKVSKMGFRWDAFIKKRKCMSLKLAGVLYVMTTKNDSKFEEELTFQLKL